MDQLKEIFYDPKNAYPNINQLSKLGLHNFEPKVLATQNSVN